MSSTLSNTQFNGLRILLVEDDALLAMEMEDMLRDHGCEVVGPLASVGKALEAADEPELHGAILDLNLRGEYSYPVIDKLKDRGVPVIVCSGYAELSEMRARLDGVPLLGKPYEPVRVLSAMCETFAGRRPLDSSDS